MNEEDSERDRGRWVRQSERLSSDTHTHRHTYTHTQRERETGRDFMRREFE